MAITVKNTRDTVFADERYSILLYGPPKTFKTRFAATAPKPLFLDFDDGIKNFKEFECDYITYGTAGGEWDKFTKDIDEIFRKCPWETLVFDSATSMSELLLTRLMMDSNKDMPTRDEYGRRAKIMGSMIAKFAKIKQKINIIFICHEGELSDDAGSLLKVTPLLPGQLKELAASQFDEVFRSEIAKITRDKQPIPVFRSSPNALYVRGSRLNLGDLEEPTWKCFMEHVEAAAGSTVPVKNGLQKQ